MLFAVYQRRARNDVERCDPLELYTLGIELEELQTNYNPMALHTTLSSELYIPIAILIHILMLYQCVTAMILSFVISRPQRWSWRDRFLVTSLVVPGGGKTPLKIVYEISNHL